MYNVPPPIPTNQSLSTTSTTYALIATAITVDFYLKQDMNNIDQNNNAQRSMSDNKAIP